MGTWGTAISSNDTFAEIYAEYIDLYNAGLSISEITEKLKIKNKDIIEDYEENHNFWFAIAKAQWECKNLDLEVYKKVKLIIESGANLELWKELGASPKDLNKRHNYLEKFLLELKTKKDKPRQRKKKLKFQPVFEKGECITYKFSNGNYGGAVVIETDNNYGYNLIATTRINSSNKPYISDFINSEILVLNYEKWENTLCISWYLPIKHKKVANLIETIGKIDILHNYDISNSAYGYVGDFNIWFIESTESQFIWEKTFSKSPKIKTIKELTKNKGWKFWL